VKTLKLACKIDMSFDDFFATDGHITFINNMASFLNINPNRIKIVSIKPGSVDVDMSISEEVQESSAQENDGSSGSGSSSGSSGSGSSNGGSSSGNTSESSPLDLAELAAKIVTASKTDELSKATGFKVAEVKAEVHDTKDYKPVAVVPEDKRRAFLEEDPVEVDGEGEEEGEADAP